MSKKAAPSTSHLDPTMIRDRIACRLAELGKTARGASREANLSESAIRNIMEGKSKSPRLDTILSLSKVLHVEPDWFSDIAFQPLGSTERVSPEEMVDVYLKQQGLARISNDDLTLRLFLPVLNDAGTYIFSNDKTFFARSEEFQQLERSVYLILVKSDEMWPVYKNDDILMVSPNLTLSVDDDFLFLQDFAESGPIEAKLARLAGLDGDEMIIQTFNPAKEDRLPRSMWKVAHKVVKRFPGGRIG